MNKEDEFKKEVIDYVYEGKYARALKLLDDKVRNLLLAEVIRKGNTPSESCVSGEAKE